MQEKLLKNIENWNEKNLSNLPEEEDDFFEYKSSSIVANSFKELKNKISKEASAFLNSGGGVLIVGVNDEGKIDGGIPKSVNRQSIRDWVDQVISATVVPPSKYKLNIIERRAKNSLIYKDKVVLIIIFYPGYEIHMAYDKKYYIRSGAHSNPANHFLIEALRARRGLQKPLLKGLLRFSDKKPNVVQLVISALNDAPAIDVKLSFDPLTKTFKEYYSDKFPLEIPAIDKNNPFVMDLLIFGNISATFGKTPIKLILEYTDIAKNKYQYNQTIDPSLCLGPMSIGPEILEKIEKTLAKIEKKLK